MKKTLTSEKTLGEIFSKKGTIDDFITVGNSLITTGLKIGGVLYAVAGSNDNSIRDGIIIYGVGKGLEIGKGIHQYVKGIYENQN